jgi:hypothetical protein
MTRDDCHWFRAEVKRYNNAVRDALLRLLDDMSRRCSIVDDDDERVELKPRPICSGAALTRAHLAWLEHRLAFPIYFRSHG